MRRHLSPVAAGILMLVLASRSGLSQDAPSVPATRVPANVFVARGPFPMTSLLWVPMAFSIVCGM